MQCNGEMKGNCSKHKTHSKIPDLFHHFYNLVSQIAMERNVWIYALSPFESVGPKTHWNGLQQQQQQQRQRRPTGKNRKQRLRRSISDDVVSFKNHSSHRVDKILVSLRHISSPRILRHGVGAEHDDAERKRTRSGSRKLGTGRRHARFEEWDLIRVSEGRVQKGAVQAELRKCHVWIVVFGRSKNREITMQ